MRETYTIGTIHTHYGQATMDIICTFIMGTICTMKNRDELKERHERSIRLREAREKAGLGGPRKLAERFGWNENTYKAHEGGRNGFGVADARRYAKGFKVSFNWLYLGEGEATDQDVDFVNAVDIPLISWVSAGALTEQAGITYLSDFPTVQALDLPDGEWIALRVEGNSMNKISPPESLIYVNLRDRRLAHNACYIVADETGAATYKRYRQNELPPFQPASYDDVPPPVFQGAVTVIGRVRRSVIEM